MTEKPKRLDWGDLNWDVLLHVVSCAPPETCAALMATCRTFYRHGAKSILARKPVFFLSPESSDLCLRFILADNHRRLSQIRDLRICSSFRSVHVQESLEQCIPLMVGLESLYIMPGEALCSEFRGITLALQNLTTLKDLQIYCAGERSREFLLASRSTNLASILLDWDTCAHTIFPGDLHMRNDLWAMHHPVPLLARWSATLESLQCHSWYNKPNIEPFDQIYPNMRRLSIERDAFPFSAPYIKAYPNLTHLFVFTGHRDELGHSVEGVPRALTEHREVNIRSQENADGPGSWRQLQEFSGTLVDLWLLGLTCHIDRIHLDVVILKTHLPHLAAVLSYAQPLHLNIHGTSAILNHATHNFSTILCGQTQAGARLQSLVFCLILREDDRNLDIAPLLHAFSGTLANLPLRRLRFTVVTCLLDPSQPDRDTILADVLGYPKTIIIPAPPPPAHPLTLAEMSLKHFDLAAFVKQLEESIPSLVDAIVEIQGVRDEQGRKGVIAREGRGVSWTIEDLPSSHQYREMYECW